MNLEVNFVCNHRMLNGEISIALKYFKYIVSTYPKHAFAHYFIAKMLLQMGKHEEANKHNKEVQKICAGDSKWLIYFKNFKIKPIPVQLFPDSARPQLAVR